MKIWTYKEMKDKVLTDLDLQDETFISPNEMIGYFNEAVTEAGSELYVLNQDYFLTQYFIPVVQSTARYNLPYNIFANRIRTIMYVNGAIIYEVSQYRRRNKFEAMIVTEEYGQSDDYMYTLWNDNPGQAVIEFFPLMRDTAILAPVANIFAPMVLFYLRDLNRVPIVGEYCNPEIFATTQVDITANTIQTYAGTLQATPQNVGYPTRGLPGACPGSIAYKLGDQVQFYNGPSGTLPAPLVQGTVYWVVPQSNGLIKLATSRANALANVTIDLTTVGTVYFSLQVAATTAIIDAVIMDVPEFATFVMQWVKCRCMEKEGDPRLEGAVNTLGEQKKQMVDTLVKGIDDDNDQIQADFSFYNDFSYVNNGNQGNY